MMRFLFGVLAITTKALNKRRNYFKVCCGYTKNRSYLLFKRGKRKTSVSVSITSEINYIFIFFHILNSKVFKLLKQQSQDNPTEIVRSDIDGAVQTLQGNDAEFVEKFMEGTDSFGTAPLRDSYLALCHTDLIGQWENVNGFINKAQYPNPNGSKNAAEWGSVGNIRIFTSSRGSITPNASLAGDDIYNIFIVAQESYSCVDLQGGTVSMFYHEPGHGDDPCHLRQTLGFRMAFGTNIDNDAWLLRLRATLA